MAFENNNNNKKNTTAHKMKTKMALIMKILSQERENVIDV